MLILILDQHKIFPKKAIFCQNGHFYLKNEFFLIKETFI